MRTLRSSTTLKRRECSSGKVGNNSLPTHLLKCWVYRSRKRPRKWQNALYTNIVKIINTIWVFYWMIEVVFIDFVCGYFPPFKGFWVSLAVRPYSACFLLVKLVVSKIVTDLCLSENCLLAIDRSCSRGYFSLDFFLPKDFFREAFFRASFILRSSRICWDFCIGSFRCWYFRCCKGKIF